MKTTKFEIDWNDLNNKDYKFLEEKLGAYWVDTGSDKYPPFEVLYIDVKDFQHLEEILNIVNENVNISESYSAVISFDPPSIFLCNKV